MQTHTACKALELHLWVGLLYGHLLFPNAGESLYLLKLQAV